ncbi:MAG TPA: SRPBCC family protein [Candidatus Binatia bacterium]
MQHIEVKRHFRAPVADVWDRYTDHADWKNWAGFSDSWLEKEGRPDRNGVGCIRVLSSNGVKVYEQVVEWEPGRRFAYRIIRGGLPLKDHYGETMFAPDGDGTMITWRVRFDSRIPGLGWLMRLIVERIFRNGLDGLAKKYFPER